MYKKSFVLICILCLSSVLAAAEKVETIQSDHVEITQKKSVEATKKAAEALAKETKKAATELKKGAEKTLKEAQNKVSTMIVAESTSPTGEELYSKCVSCHGVRGEKKAMGKSAVIAEEPIDDLVAKMKAYKEGKRNITGLGAFMQEAMEKMSESEILALAAYIDTFKKDNND
jgi:cytochrome c553